MLYFGARSVFNGGILVSNQDCQSTSFTKPFLQIDRFWQNGFAGSWKHFFFFILSGQNDIFAKSWQILVFLGFSSLKALRPKTFQPISGIIAVAICGKYFIPSSFWCWKSKRLYPDDLNTPCFNKASSWFSFSANWRNSCLAPIWKPPLPQLFSWSIWSFPNTHKHFPTFLCRDDWLFV